MWETCLFWVKSQSSFIWHNYEMFSSWLIPLVELRFINIHFKMFHSGRSTPNQPGETQDCLSPLSLSPLLHPHIVLALLAGFSLQSLLSWWQSTKSPESSFMNFYQVALVYLDLVWWNFVVNQNIGFYIYPYYVSMSDFNPISQPVKILLSCNAIIYHVNPSLYWVVYIFDKPPFIWFSLFCANFSLETAAFSNISVKGFFTASWLLCMIQRVTRSSHFPSLALLVLSFGMVVLKQ